MCADFDTRSRQDYASVGEILPGERAVGGAVTDAAEQPCQAFVEPALVEAFRGSCERFSQTLGWLSSEEAQALEHAELEERLESQGRELVRQLYQDSIDLRAAGEQRAEVVVGADGVARRSVERSHERQLLI